MYIITTKQKEPAFLWTVWSVQMSVEGTALLFQIDAVVSKSSHPNSLKLLWNFTWLNIAVFHFTFGSQTVNTMCLPLTALWAVRSWVLGGMRTQLVKWIGRVGSSIHCSHLTDFLKNVKMVSAPAFISVWSERSISLSVLKWELGDTLGAGYILGTVISGFQLHLETSEGSICW